MAHSFKRNDKFNARDYFKDSESTRRTQPYRRTKFRLDVTAIEE